MNISIAAIWQYTHKILCIKSSPIDDESNTNPQSTYLLVRLVVTQAVSGSEFGIPLPPLHRMQHNATTEIARIHSIFIIIINQ